MRSSRRKRWRNHRRNVSADPIRTCAPASVAELVAIVRRAEDEHVAVRAVGSGHSWSDVAAPDGYQVRPDRMRAPLGLEEELMGWDGGRLGRLVRVEAGMRIRELNEHLAGRDLALVNMGGYDGQTVAGVISTSTHGSGKEFGPLCDQVRSLDVVASRGVIWRIEAADGPTDAGAWRARYPEPEHRIVQDDEVFAAAVVGLGCLGVICSVILEARDAYLLTERRTPTTWEREQGRIVEALGRHRHYELLLTPYAGRDDEHLCMVTTRHPHTGPAPPWWSSRSRRNLFAETVSTLPGAGFALKALVALMPGRTPGSLEWVIHRLVDDEFTGRSYRVLNIGAANVLPARSMEIAVPVDEQGTHIDAMNAVFGVAEAFRDRGHIFHTAPIALRFVKRSPALLSMMHGCELTMTIELIVLDGSYGSCELLAAYERALRPLGGRPHWGQVNHLTRAEVERLYTELPAWRRVHAMLNASGVFDGPFPSRVEIGGRAP